MQAIRADYFGRRAIGMILGVSTVIVSIGQVCGPLVAGVLADLTGDYRLGFTLLSVISLGGAWLFIAATPRFIHRCSRRVRVCHPLEFDRHRFRVPRLASIWCFERAIAGSTQVQSSVR